MEKLFREKIKRFISSSLAASVIASCLSGAVTEKQETASAASTTYTITLPVNNGNKIAYYYGYSKGYFNYTKFHSGIDLHDSLKDDTIYAAASGEIYATANKCPHKGWYRDHRDQDCGHYKTFGNYICIKGDDGLYYYYGHLEQNTIKVKEGTKVIAGQALAKMGSSGAATGKHLHFEVRKSTNSKALNTNPVSGSGYTAGVFKYNDGPYNTKQATVKFYRNLDSSDTVTVSESFTTGVTGQKFGYYPNGKGRYSEMNDPSVGFGKWIRDGYSLLGWSENRNATKASYNTYSGVTDNWISNHTSGANLYAVWEKKPEPVISEPNPDPVEEPSDSEETKTEPDTSSKEIIAGDINFDGTVDLTDLSSLSLYLVGDTHFTDDKKKAADIDGDGRVGLTDLATLKHFLCKGQDSLSTNNTDSEWIPASETDESSDIKEVKWTYDLAETETTDSDKSELEGWTLTGTRFEKGETRTNQFADFPKGFDTTNKIFSKYNSSELKSFEDASTKRDVSESSVVSYIYWHWNYTLSSPGALNNRFISDKCEKQNINGTSYNFSHFSAFETTKNITETDKAGEVYKYDTGVSEDVSWWWYKIPVYEQTYTDSKAVNTFTRTTVKETNLESSDDPSGKENVINVKKWVKLK